MVKDQIYVVTGGSGFGKSALIKYFSDLGYRTGGEVARELIEKQKDRGGTILPEKNIRLFQQYVLKERTLFYNSVEDYEIVFSDRAIPDQIAFARYRGFVPPDILIKAANKYRYNKMVFITPPWKEIYENDFVRTESYKEAQRLHKFVVEVYRELDYLLIELPCTSVKERTNFILNLIHEKNEY